MQRRKVVKFVDNISIFSIISVSFPEALIIACLSLFSIGKFSFFKDRKNLLRILLYAAVSAVCSYFIRRNVGNENESLLVHFFISTLLFIFFLRVKFYEAILGTLFGMVFVVITETFALIPIMAIKQFDITIVKEDDVLRFLLTIPVRVLQLILAFLSYKFKIKILNLEMITIKKREYFLQVIVYVVSIATLIFLASIMSKILIVDHSNFDDPVNTLLLRMNLYLTLFVTVILTLAVRNTHEYYKDKNSLNTNEFIQNIEYISSLMDSNNYQEAKKALDVLKCHITKH
jgi:hypothetical protein